MRSSLLAIMVFLIVLLVLNSVFAPKVREHFEIQSDEIYLKSLNLCGRNITFPYFSRNNFTASQRALIDLNQGSTNPAGTCGVSQINGLVQESHSIVQENGLFYNLKSACLALRVKSFSLDEKTGALVLKVASSVGEDALNLANFLLLNPLYVEFAFNSEKSSVGYRFAKHLYFSNVENPGELSIAFERVHKTNKSVACDKLFDYKKLSPRNVDPSEKDFADAIDYGAVSMKAYYLDPVSSSIQNVGRKIDLFYDGSGLAKVFEKDYKKHYSNDYATHLYEFMNNVALAYANYSYPIFSFKIVLNVTPADALSNASTTIVCKAYMNNANGSFSECQGSTDAARGEKNHNVFAIGLSGVDERFYALHLFTGVANDCNLNSRSKLTLKLPYLALNNNVTLSFTVSANEKIALAKWQDANFGNLTTQFVYGKKSECSMIAHDPCASNQQAPGVASSLLDVFVKKESARTPPENIDLRYSSTYVKDLRECHLGYVNFLKEYLNQ